MQDGSQATIDELQKINLGTIDDPKLILDSTMLNDEEVVQYEQLLRSTKMYSFGVIKTCQAWIQVLLFTSWLFVKA